MVEVQGAGAASLLSRIATRLPGPGELGVQSLRDGERMLEEAVLVCESTERFELHLTGSPPLVHEVLALLGGETGETPESFESRAARRIGSAPSEAGARLLLDQSRGALREALGDHLEDSAADWSVFAAELLEAARVAEPALIPKRVALAGAANAGKSTLFNLLVGTDRVIVSDEPGTTRDAVSATTSFGNWPVVLIDTAGERELADERIEVEAERPERASQQAERLERAGQQVGRREREEADLVFWLEVAGGQKQGASSSEGLLVLESRADECSGVERVSSRALSSHREPDRTRALVEELFRDFFDLPLSAWSPGAAVPFEAELCALLESSTGSAALDPDGARRAVLAALGPAPAQWCVQGD